MSARSQLFSVCLTMASISASGCAYYNGIYNAKAAAKVAAADVRHGRDSLARMRYALSAESAETVLVRYPDSGWRSQALLLAGRGEALSGNCNAAIARLNEFMSASNISETHSPAERQEAQQALANCTVEVARTAHADSIEAARDSAVLSAVRKVERVAALDSIVLRASENSSRTNLVQRLTEQVLFYRLLMDNGDAPAASQFLAAEIARDSLRAPKLAYTTFMSLVGQMPASLLAPKALRAAALLSPENAPALSARILRDYPSSSVAAWMRGEDPGARADFAQTDSVLRQQWSVSARTFADTVAKLRSANNRPRNLDVSAPGARLQ